jgi:hypothetical protein
LLPWRCGFDRKDSPVPDLGSALWSHASLSLPGLPRALVRVAIPSLLAAALVVVGPWILDTYTLNILVRALFVAIAALTVDVLWGYSGTLTFGQSAFFGIGAYALAIGFTQFGFGPWQALMALGAAVGLAAVVAGFVGWLSFYPGSTPLYASCGLAGPSDRPGTATLLGRHVYRLFQRAGRFRKLRPIARELVPPRRGRRPRHARYRLDRALE